MSDLPLPTSSALASNITIRPATPGDAKLLSDSFFRSFGESNKFWSLNFPAESWHSWWQEAWRLGIEEDPTTRTYVAVDNNDPTGKVVGFARWIVPQQDGNTKRLWPEGLPDDADEGVVGAFFAGMAGNRAELMGDEPHWFLEMLGTDTGYQRHGIGYTFCKWGCELADKDDLKVYIDASEMGAPFYRKHLGAQKTKLIVIPDRPEGHGHYEYWTHIVPKKSVREKQ